MSEKLRAAAQQALEALKNHGSENLRADMSAIVALRAALAEQTVPSDCADSHQPVAWMWEETASRTSTGIGGVDRKLLFCRPVDEPWKRNITPLYIAPPQRDALLEALRFIANHDLRGADLTACGHIAHALIGRARDAIKVAEGDKE